VGAGRGHREGWQAPPPTEGRPRSPASLCCVPRLGSIWGRCRLQRSHVFGKRMGNHGAVTRRARLVQNVPSGREQMKLVPPLTQNATDASASNKEWVTSQGGRNTITSLPLRSNTTSSGSILVARRELQEGYGSPAGSQCFFF